MRSTMILATLVFAASLSGHAQVSTGASFTCSFKNAQPGDTMRLNVWYNNLSERNLRQIPYKTVTAAYDRGAFVFHVDSLEGPVYVSLYKDKQLTMAGYAAVYSNMLMEPGDAVLLSMDSLNGDYFTFVEKGRELMGYHIIHPVFSGKGSGKYAFQLALEQRVKDWQEAMRKKAPILKFDSAFYAGGAARMSKQLVEYDALLHTHFALLDTYKSRLSPLVFQVLKATVIGRIGLMDIGAYNGARTVGIVTGTAFRQWLKDTALQVYNHHKLVSVSGIPDAALCLSAGYIQYVADDAYYTKKDPYGVLVAQYKGLLRDKLVTDFLLQDMFYLHDSGAIIKDAVNRVQDDLCLKLVTNIYNMQQVGSTAFDFALQDIGNKTVRLSDFKGKIVFIDLWYTGCGACSGFYKYQLSRVEKHFEEDSNIVFITISIDINMQQWSTSVREGNYSSPGAPNVRNLYTNGLGSDHPLIKAYNVMGYPHPFMVDRQGKIYKINNLQAAAEDIIPVINEAIAKKS